MSNENDDNLVKCINENCTEKDFPENFIKGMCESCYEIDSTPTSNECDNGCEAPATNNVGSNNYCSECYDDLFPDK